MDNNITFTFTEQIPYTDKQNLQDYYNNTNRNLQKNILKNGIPFP
jgi:predicted membrane-bound dolichyl-phosphate-mannose-protein mannosyltransferase